MQEESALMMSAIHLLRAVVRLCFIIGYFAVGSVFTHFLDIFAVAIIVILRFSEGRSES